MNRILIIGKWLLIILLLLNGLFYMSNIIAFGNLSFILEMHEDLYPNTSLLVANIKVLNIFITGLCFLVSAISIMRKKYYLSVLGTIGTINFLIMYLFQIIKWGSKYRTVYEGLFTFGAVAILNGIVSFYFWRKKRIV